ncbi:hypothetical protein [Anaerotignum sp.]|uniref:hypothetical protein n=1 Tax=Anaerotignum sp. TaxID=2039241 RepID=UPI0028B06832|nr:hypothetical protein [Anaerotignum sp.]
MNEHAKGNTMYERYGAVAELNKAPGFDPLRFARRVVQNGGEKLLLDLKYKKLWFRLRYPQGRIKVTPLKITEQLAIIEAKVFFDRGDTMPAASFIAQRYAKDTPGGLYIESAQHMAVDTALNDAGFGVQLISAKEGQPLQVVATKEAISIEKSGAMSTPLIAHEPIAPIVQEQQLTKETSQAVPVENPIGKTVIPTPVAETVMQEEANVEPTVPPILEPSVAKIDKAATITQSSVVEQTHAEPITAQETLQMPSALETASVSNVTDEESTAVSIDVSAGEVRYTSDMSVDEICSLMTLDEARNIIVDVGTCKGNTLAWVSERRAASLKYYLNGYQGDNNILRAGAKLLLENLAMDKAS